MVEQLNQTLLDRNLGLDQILESYGASLADGSVDWRQALETVGKWLSQSLSGVMGSMLNLLSSAVSTAFNLLVSFIFSIYLLMGKERLGSQCARVLRTYLPERWYGGAMYVLNTVNGCFRRFVVGQCTEAVILGLLCMAGMLLLGFPYATMVGTLIGFTALIPVAGAYIGAGVGAFMIFTVSPVKALLFLLFIAVLQQLEGNLIYPRVVGASIGPAWGVGAGRRHRGRGRAGRGRNAPGRPPGRRGLSDAPGGRPPQKLASGRAAGNRTIRMTQPPLFGRLGLILSGKSQ